ncbi:MAG TPA: M48 family metalloprotease [Candidatus Sulfotelmatobacter sp.]|nr:M48 family metalloprotease [Candidatus Sulfotelmatobacter sp.]
MRIWHWAIAHSLLLTLSMNAQQSADTSSSPANAQMPASVAQPSPSSSPGQPVPRLLNAPPQPVAASASTVAASTPSLTMDQVVDRAIEREHALMNMLKTRTPFVETYLQDLKYVPRVGPVPVQDHYFLGRLDLGEGVDRRDYLSKDTSFEKHLLGGFNRLYKIEYKPMGFTWMIYADRDDFNRQTYDFRYVHREFLGDVRCIVFEVSAKKGSGNGRFRGRIWIEDQDYNIVRLNGTYEPRPRNAYFFHMDSWRVNLIAGYWVPAYIYCEEGDFRYGSKDTITFKGQTRLWGYELQKDAKDSEFTQVQVDSTVKDESPGAQDASPLLAQWQWQQQAGENVIERLQNAGLLAPAGEVDKVLETVVNNLLTSNNIELPGPVHTRVMLTLPLETFSAGNTIVVSRGLVDVLPDEASLAMVLSRELSHILLGHNMGSKYAFSDRMLFSDESTYRNLGFRHVPEEEAEADQKALDLLKNSPYAQKMNTPGLFLREVAARGPALAALLTPHLGTGLTDHKGAVDRMVALMNSAPALDPNKLDQIAALPLGGRVKLNAWDNRAELIKITPMAITSARGKMPLEITPFFPRLTRSGAVANPTAAANTATPTPSN